MLDLHLAPIRREQVFQLGLLRMAEPPRPAAATYLVAQGKNKYSVECDHENGTIHDLKVALELLTALPPEHQRLVYKVLMP